MRLFVNSLEGRATAEFFDLPDKVFSKWNKLAYWFKSTFGNVDNPGEHLKSFNFLVFKESETIKAFNLRFMKLYNRIPEAIRPTSQAALVQYYNALPPPYRHHLEEKNVNCLGSALQTCIEFEEQNIRTGLPFDQSGSKADMTSMLQMMQEMQNRMISFKHRMMANPKPIQDTPLRLM